MTKTENKTKKETPSLKSKAVCAALKLAAVRGWGAVTMQDIATECGASLADLHEIFEDRSDILSVYGRQLDHRVIKSIGKPDLAQSERDRLFDVLMERFDLLGQDRAAMRSILKSFCLDPKQAVMTLPHLGKSMVWMLECAGVDANGARGAVKALGLMGVYLYALRAWMNDESEDLSKTMAALDRALGRAEQWGGMILNRF